MDERKINNKVYRHYLYKNLDVIYDYLKYGVLDRIDIYSDAFVNWKDPAWPGMNIKKARVLDPDMLPRPGYIYKYKGNFYISYSVTQYNRHADDKGIIKWGYEKGGERKGGLTPKDEAPLFFLIPLIESSIIPKISEGDIVYSYVFLGKERIATWHSFQIKENGKDKIVKDNFRLDLTIDCKEVTKEAVAESIAIFFNIVNHAGKEKKNAGAPEDIEEAMKLVLGRECSPFRFIPALGHQLMRYIVDAFDFTKGVSGNFVTSDNRLYPDKLPDASAGYNEMVQCLFKFANKCADESKDLQTQERFRSAIEIIELIFFHKAFRNKESHSEYKINNPVLYTNYYLIDHIMLVYALVYLLKVTPKEWLSDDKTKFDATLPTNEEKKEFYNYKETDYKDLIILCLQRLKDIESSTLTEDNVKEVIKEAVSKNSSLTNDCIKNLENKIKDSTECIKGYLSEIKKIRELETRLRECEQAIAKHEKQIGKNDAEIEALKKEAQSIKNKLEYCDENTISQIETEIKKSSKRSKTAFVISGLVGLVLAVLLFVLFGMPYMHCSISNEIAYDISKTFPWAPADLSYDRAIYLENQIRENQHKDHQDGNRVKHELMNPQMIRKNNSLRAKAAECYRRAIGTYKLKVAEDPIKNAHLAARLAQMYSLGKGGDISIEEGLKYAQIAANADMGKYTGMYIYFQLSQGSMSDIKKTLANRLDYLKEEDSFYPLIKAKSDIADALSLPFPQKDSVIQHAIANVDSVALSSSPAAPFACEQLAVWYLEGSMDASGNYIINKNPFAGINYLSESALKFNSMNSQAVLADILCKFTFLNEGSELFAAAFYNGDINSGHNAYDVATRLQGKSEEEIKRQWPDLYSVKKSRNAIEKMNQVMGNLKDGNYEYALINLEGLKEDLPDNLGLIGVEDEIRKCKLHIPDSVTALKKEFASLPINSSLQFRQNIDSLIKREAVSNYLDAYLACLEDVDKNQTLIDSLLNKAWIKGFIDAGVLLADRLYNRNQYHSYADEAFRIMKDASPYSDEANLWLADKYYISNMSESRKYLDKVKDSNNFYKLIRQYDDMELDHYNNVGRYTEKDRILIQNILNSFDLMNPIYSAQDLSTYLIFCAAILGNDKFSQSALSFYLSAAHGVSPTSCAIFYPIYIQEYLQPNYRTKLEEMYGAFAKEFAFPLPKGTSPVNINYLQLRIRETNRKNEYYTDIHPYPSFLSRDLHPEPITFKDPWYLYSNK